MSLDCVLGFSAAAIASLALMRWMLTYVKHHTFTIFMWYRIGLGVFIIALYLLRLG